MQYGCQLISSIAVGKVQSQFTPANTLVMSKTLMPASGRVGEFGDTAVASPRLLTRLGPLVKASHPEDVETRKIALEHFIASLNV